MKLYATPKSHFSRKVRLLLEFLNVEYELVDIGNVADNDLVLFDGNPVMSVPVLQTNDTWLIDSDHIARHIVSVYDPSDELDVNATDPDILNLRAVISAVMANEVKLILSARTGTAPEEHEYFRKAKKSMVACLHWLEDRAYLLRSTAPTYTEFCFISMWDHLSLYKVVELNFPKLRKAAEALSQHDGINASAPPSY